MITVKENNSQHNYKKYTYIVIYLTFTTLHAEDFPLL